MSRLDEIRKKEPADADRSYLIFLIDRAAEMLQASEGGRAGYFSNCPSCHEPRDYEEHSDDCELNAWLKEVKKS